MNGYLVDTNVVSELRKPRPHGAVLAWIQSIRQEDLFLSAVTMGELQAGIELTRAQDAEKAEEIELWVDGLANSFQILSMEASCFREWGRFMHAASQDLIEDAMIAATARVHQLTLATRNERDFARFQVELFNPFKHGRH
jgi:hypothetical protein